MPHMFDVSLVDHIRLTFAHIAYRHSAHTRRARSRSRWGRALKAISTLAMTGTVVTSVAALLGKGPAYTIATVALASVSLVAMLADLLWAFEHSAHAHSVCAGRLWHLRERYQALLSDLSDGAIDSNGARARRDGLIDDLRDIYENAPAVGWHAIEAAEAAEIAGGKPAEGQGRTAAA